MSSEPAIQAEGVSKEYQIGATREPYRTLRDAITETLKRPFASRSASGTSRFWALEDVSFSVAEGEVVGIIGQNGAGKSTLLKILSRITEPTRGTVRLRGRVASLLEVGTGFHAELTGRENIFLNGAILGMKRRETARRFDEIVAFAEIGAFVDTPVKHYSSGMYLRLAFAVAAHLEPEILLVDEVLAVGDVRFQAKCVEKMNSVSQEGRTVIFVSHNLQAVQRLTRRTLLLDRGRRVLMGPTAEVIGVYLASQTGGTGESGMYRAAADRIGNHVAGARVVGPKGGSHVWGEPIDFEFRLRIAEPRQTTCFSFQVVNELQQPICHFWMFEPGALDVTEPGTIRLRCRIPKFRAYMGSYTLTTWLSERRGGTIFETLSGICAFRVTMGTLHRPQYDWAPGDCAYLEDASWDTPTPEERA